jgi:hypothetical protein
MISMQNSSVPLLLMPFGVQVTSKLAALFVQAQQKQGAPAHTQPVVCAALVRWLIQVVDAIHASPGSRAAAAVRQQLLDSQLLQHLGASMDAAAAGLTAAATALAAAVTTSTSTALPPTIQQERMQRLLGNVVRADAQCGRVLQLFWSVSNVLSPADDVNVGAMLPAMPAAVRFVLKGLQCRSRLQRFKQWKQLGQLGDGLFTSSCPSLAFNAMRVVASKGVAIALRLLPGTGELLRSPEVLSCLALVLLVTVLGLDTGSANSTGGRLSTGSSSGVGSSMSRQHPSTREQQSQQQQQQQQQQQGSGSGSSSAAGGNCGRSVGLGDAVQLGCLMPLSCSLFDMLGVSKKTAVQAARLALAKSGGWTSLDALTVLMSRYSSVLEHQVSRGHQTYWLPMLIIAHCRGYSVAKASGLGCCCNCCRASDRIAGSSSTSLCGAAGAARQRTASQKAEITLISIYDSTYAAALRH